VVPPPGAGVVTVKFEFPGKARLEAGIDAVSSDELTSDAAIFTPFSATVELAVKPVPYNVTVVAVLIGPAVGEMEVRVGAGGFAMVTVSALDKAGVEVELLTEIVAVPADVRRFAGTSATS